jgi:hypothetical protein
MHIEGTTLTALDGSARSSQRGVMPCICGADFVVDARLRAALVLRLEGAVAASSRPGSVTVTCLPIS